MPVYQQKFLFFSNINYSLLKKTFIVFMILESWWLNIKFDSLLYYLRPFKCLNFVNKIIILIQITGISLIDFGLSTRIKIISTIRIYSRYL